MKEFSEIRKNLKKDFSQYKTIRVVLLGDTSTQLLKQALNGLGYDNRYNLDIWEADYNQIERQVFDLSSDLYAHQPEIVVIFMSSHKLLNRYSKSNPNDYKAFADNEYEQILKIHSKITSQLTANILFYNFNEIDDSVFGGFANKSEISFIYQLRKLNYKLMEFSAASVNFYVCDLSTIQNQTGRSVFFKPSVYISTEMVFSLDVLPRIASITLDLINCLQGKMKKCIILDLDNTLWGGIIGDDGIENIQIGSLGIGKAFTEFQYWLKKLKNRGIILAVCSKNTETVAKEPFEKHPDMVIKLEDITVFVANWENKVDNIHKIQEILNIGFDAMVFLDDNPFERNMVRQGIPELCIPELPEDPAEYLEYLYSLNLFETSSFSDEDVDRTNLYQVEAKRVMVKEKFENEDDYLLSLNMLCKVESFNKFNIPRVAQLSQRSNQFNLRTIRLTDIEAERLNEENGFFTFAFTLDDKFGSNGLVCVVILKNFTEDALFIYNWFMSCRVLKRGMEQFVLNTLVEYARTKGYSKLVGEYIPTAKNQLVENHYGNLGFTVDENLWKLDLNAFEFKKCFIESS